MDVGAFTPLNFCFAPALCQKCKKIFTLNFKDDTAGCPDCKEPVLFYNDPTLIKPTESKGKSISWDWYHTKDKKMKFNFILPPTEYKCPQCGKMTLSFKNIGNWD